jgi:hypothetical protein
MRLHLRYAAALLMTGAAVTMAVPAQASTTPGWRVTHTFGKGTYMQDVVALSASDVWTVGITYPNDHPHAQLLHWNGKTWHAIALPPKLVVESQGTQDMIAATSDKDLWLAVQVGGPFGTTHLLHWNGTAWNQNVVLAKQQQAYSFTAVSPTDYWAVMSDGGPIAPNPMFIWHYDGSKWTKVSLGFEEDAVSSYRSTLWVAGADDSGANIVIKHLTGGKWVTQSLPKQTLPVGANYVVQAIQQVSRTDVWAEAAIYSGFSTGQLVMLHYNGRAWSNVALTHAGFDPYQSSLAPDGSGGVWFITGQNSPTDAYDYVDGHWKTYQIPATKGYEALSGQLAWLPGTHSVVLAGTQEGYPNYTAYEGTMLQYG